MNEWVVELNGNAWNTRAGHAHFAVRNILHLKENRGLKNGVVRFAFIRKLDAARCECGRMVIIEDMKEHLDSATHRWRMERLKNNKENVI